MLTRVSRLRPSLSRLLYNAPARFVSQSKSTGAADSTTLTELYSASAAVEAGHGKVSPYVKNPDFHGFSSDPVVDEWNMKVAFFLSISMALVIGGTFVHYLPDHGMRQWARREAEQLILQREKEGLPLIGENYYDPSKIVLPSAGEE